MALLNETNQTTDIKSWKRSPMAIIHNEYGQLPYIDWRTETITTDANHNVIGRTQGASIPSNLALDEVIPLVNPETGAVFGSMQAQEIYAIMVSMFFYSANKAAGNQ